MVNTFTDSQEMKHWFPSFRWGDSLPSLGKGCVRDGGTLLDISFEWVLEWRLIFLPSPNSTDGMWLAQRTQTNIGSRAETPVLRWTPTWAHLSRLASFSLLCRPACPEQLSQQGWKDGITSPYFLHLWSAHIYSLFTVNNTRNKQTNQPKQQQNKNHHNTTKSDLI